MVVQARRLSPEQQLRREHVIAEVSDAYRDLWGANPARKRRALRQLAFRLGWGWRR